MQQGLKTACRAASMAILIAAPRPAAAQGADWVSIRTIPAFADVQAQLQTLVNINARQSTNRFCVVARRDGGILEAEVYWATEDKLILWLPHLYDNEALVDSNRDLDLRRDVVPGNDVHGSTYEITQADADAILTACRRHGDQFVILKAKT